METAPKLEKPISPEEFFEKNIEIHRVSKEEFLELMKLKNIEKSDKDILRIKGITWFEENGEIIILLRTDIYPEIYMPYLEAHEKWEAYISKRGGYNLWQKSERKYKEDKLINKFDENQKEKFYKELNIYNYEFRHEYAIYKEYELAMKDGKLEEYHKWFMELRQKEKLKANKHFLQLIENDTKIRESIYKKLTENSKHFFLRN